MTKKDSSNPMLLHLLHRSRSMKKTMVSYGFPQPTRPEDIASPKPPCTPPYPPWEFAHPSPSNRSRPVTPSSYLQEIGYPRFVPERWFQSPRGGETHREDDDRDSDKEGYEEIIRQIMELYEKLPGKVKEKVSMELVRNIVGNRIMINGGGSTTGQLGLNVGSSTTSCRGLDDEAQVASPHRLERFKVKTINGGGISTNDDYETQPRK